MCKGRRSRLALWTVAILCCLATSVRATPAAPTNLVAIALSTTEVLLTWDAVNDATSYNVYQNGPLTLSVRAKGPGIASVAFKVIGLSPDKCYQFEVTAVDSANVEGSASNIALTSTIFFFPVLADSPVGYWRLGEHAGATTAADTSGHAYAGTYTGAPTLDVPGPILADNTGVTFSGTNYVTMGDVTALRFGYTADPLSVEFWIKKSSTPSTEQVLVGKFTTASSGQGYKVSVTTAGKIHWFASTFAFTTFDLTSTASVCDGAWHQVVSTWDGTTGTNSVKLYIDGSLADQNAASVNIFTGTTVAFVIGDESNLDKGWTGSLDEVAVYATALSLDRVAAHFTEGLDALVGIGTTTVKAIHWTELRTKVNALRAAASLSAATWTDDPLVAGTTALKAVHVTELRTALDAARAVLGAATLTYTDPTVTAGTTTIKAAHFTDLRWGCLCLQ